MRGRTGYAARAEFVQRRLMLKSAIYAGGAMRLPCLLILLCLTLSACGTKGPLYIPEKEYPQDAR